MSDHEYKTLLDAQAALLRLGQIDLAKEIGDVLDRERQAQEESAPF